MLCQSHLSGFWVFRGLKSSKNQTQVKEPKIKRPITVKPMQKKQVILSRYCGERRDSSGSERAVTRSGYHVDDKYKGIQPVRVTYTKLPINMHT